MGGGALRSKGALQSLARLRKNCQVQAFIYTQFCQCVPFRQQATRAGAGSTAGSPGYVLWVVWVRLRMQGPTLSTGVRGSVKVVWERFQRSREQVPRKRAKLSVWQTEFRSP